MSVVMISSAWCTAEPKPNGCVLCMREGLARRYNYIKRKSRELGLMHSNAYKSFIKV